MQKLQQSFQTQKSEIQQSRSKSSTAASPAAPASPDSTTFGREAAALNGSASNILGESNPGAGNLGTDNPGAGVPGQNNPGAAGALAQDGAGGAFAAAGPNGAYAGAQGNNANNPMQMMQQFQQNMVQMMQGMMQMMSQMMQNMMQMMGGQNNPVNGGNNANNGGNNGGNNGVNNNQNNGGNAGNFPAKDRPNGLGGITKTFGPPGSNQVSVKMPAGPGGKMINVTCNAKIADRMKAAFEEIKSSGLSNSIHSFDGSFNNRNKRGGSSKSVHAWGIAFDINAGSNPMGRSKMTADQSKIAAVFKKYGFYQLPNDPMHFQYATGY